MLVYAKETDSEGLAHEVALGTGSLAFLLLHTCCKLSRKKAGASLPVMGNTVTAQPKGRSSH